MNSWGFQGKTFLQTFFQTQKNPKKPKKAQKSPESIKRAKKVMFKSRYNWQERDVVLRSRSDLNPNRRPARGRPLKPLQKEKYGKLTPLNYMGNSVWECECECGWLILVTRANLDAGKMTSCGCGRFKDMKYKLTEEDVEKNRYNFFKVIGWSKNHAICMCVCDKEFIIKKEDLHDTLSCGCIAIGKRLPLRYFGQRRVADLEFHKIWENMLSNHKRQSGRHGAIIGIYPKWKENFIWFLAWCTAQPFSVNPAMTKPYLRRKDCNKGYHPDNCEITYDKTAWGRRATPNRI